MLFIPISFPLSLVLVYLYQPLFQFSSAAYPHHAFALSDKEKIIELLNSVATVSEMILQ